MRDTFSFRSAGRTMKRETPDGMTSVDRKFTREKKHEHERVFCGFPFSSSAYLIVPLLFRV